MGPRLRAATAAAATAVAIAAAAAPPPPAPATLQPGAFPDYLCRPTLADNAGAAWAFDLTAVASLNVTYEQSAGNYLFALAPCGVSPIACLPQTGAERWPYAPGIQFFDSGNAPGGSCYNPARGDTEPCSAMCEILGSGPPLASLLSPGNASAGLQLTFLGSRATATDPSQCPFDPVLGTETPRRIIMQHTCDPSVPAGSVVVASQYEVRGRADACVGA